jgi:hypothetical protein
MKSRSLLSFLITLLLSATPVALVWLRFFDVVGLPRLLREQEFKALAMIKWAFPSGFAPLL